MSKNMVDASDAKAERRLLALGWVCQSGITGSYWTHPSRTFYLSGSPSDAYAVLATAPLHTREF